MYVPFDCMFTLSDDVVYGGCLGNNGSFLFHFALKQLNKRAQEKLHHDDEATIKLFYKEFPDLIKDQNKAVIYIMRKKFDKVIKNLVS